MNERLLKNWQNSKYTKLIRISEENHIFLKSIKNGRYSLAGILNNIINNHKCILAKNVDKIAGNLEQVEK